MSDTNELTRLIQRTLQEPGPLLIITLREPLSYLIGLAILLDRARNSRLTHLASVDTILSPIVDDLTQHYDNVLVINVLENADKKTLEKFHRKNLQKLLIEDVADIREVKRLLTTANSKMFCELAECLLYYEHDVGELSLQQLRQTEYPPLPGASYLDLDTSMRSVVIPAPFLIGNLTTSQKSLSDLTQEEFLNILLSVAKKIYENKQALTVLDIFCKRDYTTQEGVSAVEYLTVVETMFSLETYIASPIELALRPRIFADPRVRELVRKYADMLREMLTKGAEIDNVTMFYRLCIYRSIARQKADDVRLCTRDGIVCMPCSENVDFTKFRTYNVQRVRPNLQVVCYESR